MDWKLFSQLVVTVLVALLGGWLGHNLAARRDLLNERRKLRVSYLLEAYRKLEDGGNRSDPDRSWPKFESAIADIQLLGTPKQVQLARQFAHGMARNLTASLDELVNDLRRSLRKELQLPAVEHSVVYLRFNGHAPPHFEQTLTAVIRDIEDTKLEAAANAAPEVRRALEGHEHKGPLAFRVARAWEELENIVRDRLSRMEVLTQNLGTVAVLNLAVHHQLLTDVQCRSLKGLNAMRNMVIHGRESDIDEARVGEFLTLADAMKTVLEITASSDRTRP